jgi:hypothetical protein
VRGGNAGDSPGRGPPLLDVDRPAGRREDDLTHALLDAVLEEVSVAQHVGLRVEVRLVFEVGDVLQ